MPLIVEAPASAPPASMARAEISQVTSSACKAVSILSFPSLASRTKSRITSVQTTPPTARVIPVKTRPQATGPANDESCLATGINGLVRRPSPGSVSGSNGFQMRLPASPPKAPNAAWSIGSPNRLMLGTCSPIQFWVRIHRTPFQTPITAPKKNPRRCPAPVSNPAVSTLTACSD